MFACEQWLFSCGQEWPIEKFDAQHLHVWCSLLCTVCRDVGRQIRGNAGIPQKSLTTP